MPLNAKFIRNARNLKLANSMLFLPHSDLFLKVFIFRSLGILERHSDYKIRAKDNNRKKDTIKALQEKAAAKNPDEFYFKMVSSKTEVVLCPVFLFK
jgi:hypothetical protein